MRLLPLLAAELLMAIGLPGVQAAPQRLPPLKRAALERLAAAIAHTGHSRFVLDAIGERERELDVITHRLQTAHPRRRGATPRKYPQVRHHQAG